MSVYSIERERERECGSASSSGSLFRKTSSWPLSDVYPNTIFGLTLRIRISSVTVLSQFFETNCPPVRSLGHWAHGTLLAEIHWLNRRKQRGVPGGEQDGGAIRQSIRQNTDTIPTQYRRSPRHNTDIVPTQYRHSPTTLSKITRRGRNPQNSKEQAVPRPSEAPQTPEIPVTTP